MHRPTRSTLAAALSAALIVTAGCGQSDDSGSPAPGPDAFWAQLTELCGQAYPGRIAASAPAGADDDFAGRDMVMHVRECEEDVIRIPFHVGDDRSRTWIISRTDDGLRLKHDHRHEDGTPDAITMYGGDTDDSGTPTRQDFPADAHTAEMLPAAATNVWTLEIEPGQTFAYELRREGTDRRFRAEFDLSNPVDPPAAPWGWD